MALAAVVGTALIVLLLAVNALDRASEARTRTARIISAGKSSEKAIVDMETGLRGYLLTGQRRFLDPWFSGSAAFDRNVARLQDLTATGGPEVDRVVRAIRVQGDAYASQYGAPIAQRGAGEGDKAAVAAGTAAGKRRVNALRGLFDRLNAINNDQAQSRIDVADAARGRARRVVSVALMAMLALIALAALYLVRSVSLPVRRIARAADALSGGEFSVRAPVQGPGEVAQLGRSFNAMAASIENGLRTVTVQNERLEASRADAEAIAAELAAQQELAVDLVATVVGRL